MSLVRKVGRLARTLAPLPLLGGQYLLHRASGDRWFAARRHAFSRLLAVKHMFPHREGMTSLNERAFFEWYGRHLYTGRGELVDLGCWLGSTTVALAMGLAGNPRAAPERRIHAYDLFEWEPMMAVFAGDPTLEQRYQPGDSFVDEFERRCQPWLDRIEIHKADLSEHVWTGGPIEFLLVDAMKNVALMNAIKSSFFPAMVPGVSVMVHQDFCHYWEGWIHLLQYRLRDCFEPIYDVPLSGSFAFRLTAPLPDWVAAEPLRLEEVGRDEIDAAFDYSSSLVGDEGKIRIAAGKAMLLLHLERRDEVRAELDRLRAAGYPFDSEIGTVAQILAGSPLAEAVVDPTSA